MGWEQIKRGEREKEWMKGGEGTGMDDGWESEGTVTDDGWERSERE